MRLSSILALIVCLSCCAAATRAQVVTVSRPTVVAYFPPVTEGDLLKDPDTNEALADFRFNAGEMREPLRNAGIDFYEIHAALFKIQDGRETLTVRPKQIQVGYLLIAPGRSPRTEAGVMTSSDLFEAVREYFAIIVKAKGGPSQ